MTDTETRIRSYITSHNLIEPGDAVLAAVSGGADSMCMLLILNRLGSEMNFRLGVVSVDHGFRPEAADEAAYVGETCDRLGLQFYLCRIEPGSIQASEEAARDRRYEMIREVADREGFGKIALAHNADDRAETMLFNLFRGTGISGLSSISPYREHSGHIYIRPILCLERSAVEAYLDGAGVKYCTDSTNNEDIYARNRIRHHIIPDARSINDGAVAHMNRTADMLTDIGAYITERSLEAYERICTPGPYEDSVTLGTDALSGLHEVIRTEVVRLALSRVAHRSRDIGYDHVRSVIDLLSDPSGAVSLPYGMEARRVYGDIMIRRGSEAPRDERLVQGIAVDLRTLTGDGHSRRIPVSDGILLDLRMTDDEDAAGKFEPVLNSCTKCFDYDKINPLLTFRYVRPTDRMIIDTQGHTKALNRYMIDEKIPAHARDRIQVLADGDEVLWVIGYRDSAGYRITGDTKRILTVSLQDDSGPVPM